MTPSNSSDQRYDQLPPIPTYEEAIAAGSGGRSAHHHDDAHSPIDPDDPHHHHSESHSLLPSSRHAFESTSNTSNSNANRPLGRWPRGYHPPTVESDNESDLLSSLSTSSEDDDSDDEREAAQVRREMQELEIDDSDVRGGGRSLSWGKRIGRLTSLSLLPARWRGRWRVRLPRLRRGGGDGVGGADAGTGAEAAASGGGQGQQQQQQQQGQEPGGGARRWLWRPSGLPEFGSAALLLLVGRMLAIMIVLGFLYAVFASDMFSGVARRMGRQYDPESVRAFVQGNMDSARIRDHLKHFTSYAHMAGTEGDYALMEDIEMLFRSYGLEDVTRDEYHVYLNYPKTGGRAVEILGQDGQPVWTARLEEEEAGSRTAGRQTYVFHGHSKSGDVKGPLVYANYGSREDFQALKDMGVGTRGAIALVKYDGSLADQALKVKAAEMAGFAGCLIYTDPSDNGAIRGETAPGSRFLPADGVQRGSVSLRNWVVGDVLTPGWGSKQKMPRMKLDQTHGLVKIPSLPLSWRDAQTLLQHLKGAGQRIPDDWVGNVPEAHGWWTGNSSASPIVRLKNEQDEVEKQPIWNVYGKIIGIEQDQKKVIIGNHRDSFAFGAGKPNSGTAVMMEVARVFGELLARGWRPQRTIEFMSWDGGEYNLIGSTEYVEQNDEELRQDALAYINLDAAVTGRSFRAAGSPVFRKLLLQVLNRVFDDTVDVNASLREMWDKRGGELEALGTGSDYVAFQNIVGTSSLDVSFEGDVFPSQSSYDNFDWMQHVGDPSLPHGGDGDGGGDADFYYHNLLSQVVALLILELSDRPVMPFDMTAYANDLARWVSDLESWIKKQSPPKDIGGGKPFSLDPLINAAKQVATAVEDFNQWETAWETAIVATNGWEAAHLGVERYRHNSQMAQFESDLLDPVGITGRTQYKHVVFGPQLWSTGASPTYFPAIRDAALSGNWTLTQETVDRVAGIIAQAAANLAKP
ncbi:hypothetical protein VTK26DRAFT_4611 [Humicola hyalothermophila]